MRSLINLVVLLAGITLLFCTVFVESLSGDAAGWIGTAGFILTGLGWLFNVDNSNFKKLL